MKLRKLLRKRNQKRRNVVKTLKSEQLETRRVMATVTGDFNGDSIDDLAYGTPGEDGYKPLQIGSLVDAGAVNIIYGQSGYTGLTTQGNEVLRAGWASQANDRLGEVMAAGDFNGDGYDDLAIGVPSKDVNGKWDAGAVHLFYGSSQGLRSDSGFTSLFWSPETWHQGSLTGGVEAGDRFGASLAVGDFDNDGMDDLAVGVPGEDLGTKLDAGAVNVIFGSPNGLSAVGNQLWHQNSPGIHGAAEAGDQFGAALAAGDFNQDGRDDLAIGVPNEDIGSIPDAGAVNVLYGLNANGLSAWNDQIWHQNSTNIDGVAGSYDRFGASLAVGDFDNNGLDDLAIGVPGDDVGTVMGAGAVNVIYGRSTTAGLTSVLDQLWHQNSYGIAGVSESGDAFGESLAVGDFDNNGYDDLAIGAPGESLTSNSTGLFQPRHGVVNVLYGGSSYIFAGLRSAGDQLWHQNVNGILDTSESWDGFADALATGDFNGDGRADLAIYVSSEIVGSPAVNVIYGRSNSTGLSSFADQIWYQGRSDNYGQIGEKVEWSDGIYVPPPQ